MQIIAQEHKGKLSLSEAHAVRSWTQAARAAGWTARQAEHQAERMRGAVRRGTMTACEIHTRTRSLHDEAF